MEKLKIPYPVIVEGKYDRERLLSVIEAQILTTDGFAVFTRKEKRALFRLLAEKSPLIVLTDPDGAGALIRRAVGAEIPADRLIPLYVPRVAGKDARKSAPNAEGVLGVESQEREVLYRLFSPFAGTTVPNRRTPFTKLDLYEAGLTGAKGSAERRARLAAHFALPPDMTPNALLAALSVIATREEFETAVEAVRAKGDIS